VTIYIPSRQFFIKTLLLLWLMRLGLWLMPFRLLYQAVDKLAVGPAQPLAWPQPEQMAGTVTLASRYVPRATCLTQALVTQILLARFCF
jgi:hypothetical protein